MIRVGRGAQWSPEACAGARGPPRISHWRPLPRTPGRLPRPPEDAAASTTPCDTGELPDCLGFNLGSAVWPAVRPWAGDLTSLCGRCDESLVPSQGVAVRGSGVFTCQCVDQCPRPKLVPYECCRGDQRQHRPPPLAHQLLRAHVLLPSRASWISALTRGWHLELTVPHATHGSHWGGGQLPGHPRRRQPARRLEAYL